MSNPIVITRGSITCTLWLGDCFELASKVGSYNHVITDPPFSERTHKGHDSVSDRTDGDGYDNADRKVLGYAAWDNGNASDFCRAFNPDGWCCILTDHMLARAFQSEAESIGRYVFAPLPSFSPGRSVRLTGDGPSSWTDWIVVSRTKNQVKWGTLPGGYINRAMPRGNSNRMGGKPIGLMCSLVNDYSRAGDTVIDPCMGAGTTGLACLMTGRNFIGIEKDEATFRMACERIQREANQATMFDTEPAPARDAGELIETNAEKIRRLTE